MVLVLLRNVWRWNVVLSEFEIRNIRDATLEHLGSVVDPVERKATAAFLAGLECCLNE